MTLASEHLPPRRRGDTDAPFAVVDVPRLLSEEIHRLIPGSDLRIFEHSSHSIRADEPEAMMDAIRGFLVYTRQT